MPRPEDIIMQFSKPQYQHPVPYIIYADFESILVPMAAKTIVSDVDEENIELQKKSFSNTINSHQACGFAYVVVGPDGECYKKIKCYSGENAVEEFFNEIIQVKDELAEILAHIVPIQMIIELSPIIL